MSVKGFEMSVEGVSRPTDAQIAKMNELVAKHALLSDENTTLMNELASNRALLGDEIFEHLPKRSTETWSRAKELHSSVLKTTNDIMRDSDQGPLLGQCLASALHRGAAAEDTSAFFTECLGLDDLGVIRMKQVERKIALYSEKHPGNRYAAMDFILECFEAVDLVSAVPDIVSGTSEGGGSSSSSLHIHNHNSVSDELTTVATGVTVAVDVPETNGARPPRVRRNVNGSTRAKRRKDRAREAAAAATTATLT